jgi:phage/plasmid-like protein (TIGR03299 family)
LAKLPNDILVFNDDILEKYLILTNSHDGLSACRVYFSTVRVVCQNTLNASLRSMTNQVVIRHKGDIMAKVKEARKVLGLALDFYNDFEIDVKAMAQVQMNTVGAREYFDKVLQIDDEKEASTKAKNDRDIIHGLFENGAGNNRPGNRRTLWTALNAVTEFADHKKTVKNLKENPSNRLQSVWFGSSARLKERALNEAMVLLKK